jgi:hypothetical protein
VTEEVLEPARIHSFAARAYPVECRSSSSTPRRPTGATNPKLSKMGAERIADRIQLTNKEMTRAMEQ